MSRMIEALKLLEGRRQGTAAAERDAQAKPARAAAPKDVEHSINEAARHVAEAMAIDSEPLAAAPIKIASASPPAPLKTCILPVTAEVADCYLELAERMSEQLASNYCNVVLFVGPDGSTDPSFSMVDVTRAFALQSVGDVLLVDGDLRYGHFSRSVCLPGPGMVEVMLGAAHWGDVIHSTNMPRISFVPAGTGQVPTFDRPEFGWGALRPKYRAVLIGLGAAAEPEITWLASRCDAVYFVLSRPHTSRQAASAAINGLRACGANVLGCVVVDG